MSLSFNFYFMLDDVRMDLDVEEVIDLHLASEDRQKEVFDKIEKMLVEEKKLDVSTKVYSIVAEAEKPKDDRRTDEAWSDRFDIVQVSYGRTHDVKSIAVFEGGIYTNLLAWDIREKEPRE